MATRDPEATKERILAAALHEFSAKGISGTRVDAIAAHAQVNKRMLYYYFGSKDGLFREILRRRVDESAAAMESADVASTHRLANTQRSLAKDVEYVRLLAWEALESRPNQPVNEAIRKRFFRSLDRGRRGGATRGQAPGRPRRGAARAVGAVPRGGARC